MQSLLFMLLQCDIKIKRIIPFIKSNSNKSMFPFIILNSKDKISTAIESFYKINSNLNYSGNDRLYWLFYILRSTAPSATGHIANSWFFSSRSKIAALRPLATIFNLPVHAGSFGQSAALQKCTTTWHNKKKASIATLYLCPSADLLVGILNTWQHGNWHRVLSTSSDMLLNILFVIIEREYFC